MSTWPQLLLRLQDVAREASRIFLSLRTSVAADLFVRPPNAF
jgi:hypothetical protein